jgi:DNA invertase Pin-like site-specific DNA recombinase
MTGWFTPRGRLRTGSSELSARCRYTARERDTLMVWKLDRLGRSLRDLITIVADLETRGIGFQSLQESIDTTTPGGRVLRKNFIFLALDVTASNRDNR